MFMTILGAITTGAGVGGALFGAAATISGTSETVAVATGTLVGAGCGLLAAVSDAVVDVMAAVVD